MHLQMIADIQTNVNGGTFEIHHNCHGGFHIFATVGYSMWNLRLQAGISLQARCEVEWRMMVDLGSILN